MQPTISGLEKLSRDYNRGYTRAIQDLISIFDYIRFDLEHHHKRMNSKIAMKLLQCCLNSSSKLRDNIGNGFIRYNDDKPELFEYYIPKE